MFWKRRRSSRERSPHDDPGWPFDQAPDAAAITVRSVIEGGPVLFVSHDADDHGWQFLYGREPDMDAARVVGMAEALGLDPTLAEVAHLPPGWIAWRARIGDGWRRQLNPRPDE
jgi:hypothetical protein